ncbi:MAG: S8 family serine peptidase [Chloroflexi bacterium]|nr:S8 family serine peptidase [Chloroflexota bacterium]
MRLRPTCLAIAAATLLGVPPTAASTVAAAGPTRDVLVGVRSGSDRGSIRSQARALGVTPTEIYVSSRAFATHVSAQQAERLERDPRVTEVIDDDLLAGISGLDDADSKIVGRPARERLRRQVTPRWLKRIGITRVDRRLGSGKHRPAFDADVAIIDSGISRHPDVRTAGGKDCTRSGSWRDGYGHGTGVASILGGRDNNKGIVGVVPGVRLWSVRIFDSRGRTRLSWVLCGLDWVARKRDPRDKRRAFFEGVTLSFSIGDSDARAKPDQKCGTGPVGVVHRAICRIERRGTILVAAAGNYGQKAAKRLPASYQEVITVSALADFDGRPGGRGRQAQACSAGAARERDDRFASFSSFGEGVDLIAPGKCIWVAYAGKSYARVSGTSFAAPMVLGVALRYRKRYPAAQPNQVRQALIYAGSRRWRVASDPDGFHEPLVDARRLKAPPRFEYGRVGRRSVARGAAVRVSLRVHRQLGHTARISIRTAGVPAGVTVAIDGSRVTIRVRDTAATGRRSVILRASDGEVRRTIRIPIRVTRD